MRTPFHTIIMAVGIIGILIVGLLYLLAEERGKAVVSFAAFGWGMYLIAVVKFLPQTYFLLTALLLSAIALYFLLRMQRVYLLQVITIIFLLISSTALAMMPKDERYYLLSIRFNTHVENDYNVWDKYSWFLNLSGKKTLAIEANAKALEIVESSNDESMKKLIKEHKELLEQDIWKRYR